MSTVAILGLALTVGGLVAAVLVLVRWGKDAIDRRGAEQDKARAEADARAKVESERDDALASLARVTVERDSAREQVEVHKQAAQRAREELTRHVKERLATGSPDDVAAEVDRLLGEPL